MSRPDPHHLPIGYWLKRADELLTRRIDEAQRENGLSRLGWQTLNVIREAGGADADHVTSTLSPFASAADIRAVLDALQQRGLLEESAGRVRLTEPGSEVFARALSSQKAVREGAFEGIERSRYDIAVGVLRQLVENLERDVNEQGNSFTE